MTFADDDTDEPLDATPLEHQDLYDVAHSHGYARVMSATSTEILERQFGPLDSHMRLIAAEAYEAGRREATRRAAELTRPLPVSAEIPW